MSQYYNLKVKKVIRETEEAVTLVFDKPKEGMAYSPGQFLTLIMTIAGEKLRRSYSLCSSPFADADLAVTIKKVPGGKMSTYVVDKVKEGDAIEVMTAMGTFTAEVNEYNKRNVLLIGAGSGITPLMSILKSVLVKEPLSNVFLIYGNRNEKTIIYKNELENLSKEHGGRLKIVHRLSQPSTGHPGASGRLNRTEIIKIIESFEFKNLKSEVDGFVCGPDGMMEEAIQALELMEIPKEKIRKESFIPASSSSSSGAIVAENQTGDVEVTVLYQGTEYKFKVPKTKSILEAALDEEIDLPYSCQSGMCTACMGKCKSGKVHLDNPDGLSDKEIKMGYVLTCVGHPVSNDVVIEID